MKNQSLFYIGTYTEPILHGTGDVFQGKGDGIYLVSLDEETGALCQVCLAGEARNPSFLCVSPCRRFVYAVNELKEYDDQAQGSVSAFAVEEEGRKLRLLNKRPTGGTDPCHVAVSPDGKHLIVSNFMSGSICLYGIKEDGSLEDEGQFIQHSGSGPDPMRQKGPHAHAATFDESGEYAYVPDLGIDQIKVYRLDREKQQLEEVAAYQAPPGSGPRYCETGRKYGRVYCVNELACSVATLERNGNGFSLLDTQTMTPGGEKGDSIAAALHVAPGGQYVYASLRGHDEIVIYQVEEGGNLTCLAGVPSGGKVPRDFILSKSGNHLLVANQNSDVVIAFHVCHQTGALKQASRCEIPTPVCVCQLTE